MCFPVVKRCKESIDYVSKVIYVCLSTYLDILWRCDQEIQCVCLSLRGAYTIWYVRQVDVCISPYLDTLWSHDQELHCVCLSLRYIKIVWNVCP